MAIDQGHERIVEILVNFGADLLYKPPQSGLNATQLASKLGQDRIVKFLTFYSQKKKVPKQEIPRILDGPEKANKLLKVAKSQIHFFLWKKNNWNHCPKLRNE